MSSSATPQAGALASLPIDLLLDHLFPHLSTRSLLALGATCRDFQSLTSADLDWKRRIRNDYRFPVDATARTTGFKTLYARLSRPRVYVWGQNRNGRLGLKRGDPSLGGIIGSGIAWPVRLTEGEGKGWVDIRAGGGGFHALDWKGGVWAWGTLDGGMYTASETPYDHPGKRVDTPIKLPVKDLPPISTLTAGRSHALALSDSKEVFEWHAYARIARLVKTPWAEPEVAQIAAGWGFSSVLNKDGSVWAWNVLPETVWKKTFEGLQRGEGAVKDWNASEWVFRCPDLPKEKGTVDASKGGEEEKIVKVAAGNEFIVALTSHARVFRLDLAPVRAAEDVDGDAESIAQAAKARLEAEFLSRRRRWEYLPKFCDVQEIAKLDAFDQEKIAEDRRIRPPVEGTKVTHISAMFNTFAVYSVTDKPEESIVLLGKPDTTVPEVVPELQGIGVIDIVLGDYHRGALLSTGQLLTWGAYSAGALGLTSPPQYSEFDTIEPSVVGGPAHYFAAQGEDVLTPTQVSQFAGADKEQGKPGSSAQKAAGGKEREFVFAASFAGWHSGCLAVSLSDKSPADHHTASDVPPAYEEAGAVEAAEDGGGEHGTAAGGAFIPAFRGRIGHAGRGLNRGGLPPRGGVVRPGGPSGYMPGGGI